MSDTVVNLCLLIGLALLVMLFFKSGFNKREGMVGSGTGAVDASGNPISNGSTNGVAGNITNYLANLQAKVIQYQDQFLISKYRTDYENTILKVDDLVNALMLETTLSIDPNNPMAGLAKMGTLNGAKLALNSVMKYVDGSH